MSRMSCRAIGACGTGSSPTIRCGGTGALCIAASSEARCRSSWQGTEMDIGFTEEQELLRDTARKFLDSQCPTKFVREMMATGAAVTEEFWRKLADNGWLGITYPEDAGGSGLGLVDLVVLMEEIGRAVMPGPYLATVLLGGAAIAAAGSPEQRRDWLPRIAAGELKATLAVTEPNARWDAAGITAPARETRGGFTLSGTKMFVPDAHLGDVLVVAARSRDGSTMEDGVSLFLVPKDMPGLAIPRLLMPGESPAPP